MEPAVTRILLADDHGLVRQGLRLILDGEPDLAVVAEAGDGAEAVELAAPRRRRPGHPRHRHAADDRPAGGPRDSPAARPDVRILMLSMYDNEQYFFEALKAGACGLRAEVGRRPRPGRGVPGGEARRAVPVRRARSPRSSATTCERNRQRRRACPSSILTPREEEIVKLIAEGHSSKEIADTAGHQRQDRRPAPGEHPAEARHARPARPDPLRHPRRAGRALTEPP